MLGYKIKPVSLKVAQEFVRLHHRHNKPPVGHKFSVGLFREDKLLGVAVAGRPVARMLDNGMTLEVTRTCTDGTRNANSMLYGAIVRAALHLVIRSVLRIPNTMNREHHYVALAGLL